MDLNLESARPMYLTKLSKVGFGLVYVAFIVFFAITVIIALFAGPKVFNTFETWSDVDMANEESRFSWRIDGLERFNQQLWLQARIENKLMEEATIDVRIDLAVKFEGSNTGGEDDSDWTQILYTTGETDRARRSIRCSQGSETCTPMEIIHEPYLKFTHYRVSVSFSENPGAPDFIGRVKFVWITVNPNYTFFEMWFRIIFLSVTFLGTLLFLYRLQNNQFPFEWSLEQRWLFVLLSGLIGFNNPTFPLQLVFASWIGDFLDSLFVATFIATLFLFWLCYFDGITKTAIKRHVVYFYAPKVVLVGSLWVAFLVVFTMQQLHQNDNPTYTYVYDNPAFSAFLIIGILVTIVYLFMFLYFVFRAFNHPQKLPLLRTQLNFITGLTVLVAIVVVLGLVVGFVGVVANSAAQWLSIYSLLNIYVWSLAVVWGPTGEDNTLTSTKSTMGSMQPLEEEDDDTGVPAT